MKKILTLAVLVMALWFGVNSTASAGGYDCYNGCYVVMYGDTMFSIGRQFDKDPYYLAHVNGLNNPNHIYAGQVLYIPTDGPGYPWGGGCDYDCGYDDMSWRPEKPMGHDNMGWDRKPGQCGDDCSYYGYDYTGYYYGSYYPHKQYSYTCGYHSNCY